MPECYECASSYNLARQKLGYDTCLECGEKEARKRKFCVAPLSKSNYILITNVDLLKQLNKRANITGT